MHIDIFTIYIRLSFKLYYVKITRLSHVLTIFHHLIFIRIVEKCKYFNPSLNCITLKSLCYLYIVAVHLHVRILSRDSAIKQTRFCYVILLSEIHCNAAYHK
jgi:hypothetical protein